MKYLLLIGIIIIILLSTFGKEISDVFRKRNVEVINGIKVVSTIEDGMVIEKKFIRIDVIPNYFIECKEGFSVSFRYRRCMPFSYIEKHESKGFY